MGLAAGGGLSLSLSLSSSEEEAGDFLSPPITTPGPVCSRQSIVMSLVSFVETTYALSVPFSDVLIENFESIDAIAGYLKRRAHEA